MTAQRFNALNILEQARFLWEHGIPVGELHEKHFACSLYQVDNFYVEVRFNNQNLLLYKIFGFTHNCPALDQYIKSIDLSGVLCS
jgi:hypothetical protein